MVLNFLLSDKLIHLHHHHKKKKKGTEQNEMVFHHA